MIPQALNEVKERSIELCLKYRKERGEEIAGKQLRALLEDLRDLAIIAERKGEPSQSFGVVKKMLERKWQATASK